MCVQTCPAASQHISIWNSLSVDPQRGRRLEATHHGEADTYRNPKATQRWAKHRESRPAIAPESLQKQQGRVYEKGQSLCSQLQEEKLIDCILLWLSLLHKAQIYSVIRKHSPDFTSKAKLFLDIKKLENQKSPMNQPDMEEYLQLVNYKLI